MKRLLIVLGILGTTAMLGGCDKCGDFRLGWNEPKTCSSPNVR